jgi:hypothetical protein
MHRHIRITYVYVCVCVCVCVCVRTYLLSDIHTFNIHIYVYKIYNMCKHITGGMPLGGQSGGDGGLPAMAGLGGIGGGAGGGGGHALGGGGGAWGNAAFADAVMQDPAIMNVGQLPPPKVA